MTSPAPTALSTAARDDLSTNPDSTPQHGTGSEWWRTAVIYQIYPRSFADSDGDGIGDLPGITERLPALRELGVDAVWLSPFFLSPQNDAGYDVADYCAVDPLFGTLDDFERMQRRAHELGLRVIVDIVPNHTSSAHRWFQEALAAPAGSEERARYMFRDGKGADGELPPNNWESIFGGPAWTRLTEPDGTPGQWYLHLFDSSQPDLDWTNPWVRERFREILRFWLDRGVDGFRVDVAHGMVKAPGLPDYTPPEGQGSMGGAGGVDDQPAPPPPYFAQEGVHEIYREWREIFDSYEGDRAMVAEAWVEPLAKLADWVRPDEMHQAFNFSYLETPWDAAALRRTIDASLATFSSVGAPSTWVLSNHDVVRHASRLALSGENPQGVGIGPLSTVTVDEELGLRRARAASALMLALPGSAYIYQGEELGLPEDTRLPDEARQDPTFHRTAGERYGRDGCRVPIPWEAGKPSYGFSEGDASWLPQPDDWDRFARDAEQADPASTLSLYTEALLLRREHGLALGTLEWITAEGDDVIAFESAGVTVIANLGDAAVPLPEGRVLLASRPLDGDAVPSDTTVWLIRD
ncbi:glycoside hydrolase family 13 protein [Clavibacter michiganensis]|uniref:glycoside hydrolase family 13 protein n=1 Tax=Clavibacter michiganensis TaxID=28447 RepID=UPI001D0AB070|nr:glycoside hydrolase family 13 protein [Clavibacter michiganensis]MDO4043980.1 glycoside hydrolase family 13 protein [Clavibacter michiganensis]MDO4052350.1 glycoside hydrolase family 13 protein [Clavibacter michiganensis]MDO4056231.1 glycoside hydrolase family 13 protein [Clavibacter michiganensis]MDO4068639.1 glycoside hydrolase family 13 protein [Clavibacter michiganensis]UDM13601.1 glycoside hydrolase family 13 protein [Clavibacter michiganensis subsp. michiganensis]